MRSVRPWPIAAGRWPASKSGPAGHSPRSSGIATGSGSPKRLAVDAPAATQHADHGDGDDPPEPCPTDGLEALARNGRQVGGSDVGIGIRVRARGQDTAVSVVVVLPDRVHRERRMAFLGGTQGRLRAALVAAHILVTELRGESSGRSWRADPAARCASEAVEVDDDDAVPLEADEAVVGEHAEELVHALTRAADHRGQVALGQRRPQPDRAVSELLARFRGKSGEARSEPAGDVEEVEFLDMVRQAAELRGERREQGVADGGLRGEQLAKLGPRQDERLSWFQGRGGGGSRRPVEEGQLAEDIARSEGREDRLVAGVGWEHDLDRPAHDDEQGIPGVAEMEDHLAPAEPPRAHPPTDPLHAGGVETGEERDAGQRFGERAGRDHESHPTAEQKVLAPSLSECRQGPGP